MQKPNAPSAFFVNIGDYLRQQWRDPVYQNTFFLLSSSIIGAVSGFFFWLIAARFYSTSDIGYVSAIASAMGLLSLLSLFGFDITLVRFLPVWKAKNSYINTFITVSLILSLLLSSIFIGGIDLWSPSLQNLRNNQLLILFFISFTATLTVGSLLNSGVFVGLKKTKYSFFMSLATIIRIFILPFCATFGAIGLFALYGLSPIFSVIIGLFLMSRMFSLRFTPELNREIVPTISSFSVHNYLGKILETIPTFILPIIVINTLGAEENAFFFIAWSIAGILNTVPAAACMVLLSQYVEDRAMFHLRMRKLSITIVVFLLLAISMILIFGKSFLLLFGPEYASHSYYLLVILSLASIPFTLISVYVTMKRYQQNTKSVIYVFGGITVLTLLVSLYLLPVLGIAGIGCAWLGGNLIVGCFIGLKYIVNSRSHPCVS
jgi:O-antigen/teichoic acid export membrane protein